MAKATANCTCRECGKSFTKTTTKHTRKEADSWEEWATAYYDQCPQCWGAAQRAIEAARPLTLVLDCDPYRQIIILHFEGDTMSHKEEIKALGYSWRELPQKGAFGVLSTSRAPLVWQRIIELDQIETELDKTSALQPELKNNMTDIDIAIYREIKCRKDAEKAEEAARKAEIDTKKSAVPRPKVPMILAGVKWNQQIYGKLGGYRIYLNGIETKITDSEEEELKAYLAAKEVYIKSITEIENSYAPLT